jgi:hypothetical protein
MYAGFILRHFQHMAGASFDAAPASGAIGFNHTDDQVPVPPLLPPAVQMKENPQQDYNSCADISYVHSSYPF